MLYDISQIYFPAEDTYLMRDAALSEVTYEDSVLEMGVGSGEVASAIQSIARKTLACDINPHAVAYAREIHGLTTVQSDLFSGVSGLFTLIIFNAPYLPTKPNERINDWLEYALDGGSDGRSTITRFLQDAPRYLADNGRILLLISSLTGLDEVSKIAQKNELFSEVLVSEREDDGEYLYVLKIRKK